MMMVMIALVVTEVAMRALVAMAPLMTALANDSVELSRRQSGKPSSRKVDEVRVSVPMSTMTMMEQEEEVTSKIEGALTQRLVSKVGSNVKKAMTKKVKETAMEVRTRTLLLRVHLDLFPRVSDLLVEALFGPFEAPENREMEADENEDVGEGWMSEKRVEKDLPLSPLVLPLLLDLLPLFLLLLFVFGAVLFLSRAVHARDHVLPLFAALERPQR